ncbi:MAG: hypothetical protein JHC95_10360 [Solirubrobacteraceae bacterium]|nr:hypothetical protein [Solirubrobacteraceae bacterium]
MREPLGGATVGDMTMTLSRGRAMARSAVVATLVALAAPAGAGAQAATTVTLERGAPVRDCITLPLYGRRCGGFGMTKVTVSWAVPCPGGTASSVSVYLLRRSGATPAADDAVVEQVPDPVAFGNERFTIEPGQRVYGSVRATCIPAGDDPQSTETATTSAALALPPALVAYVIRENRICGFPRMPLQTVLQARNWAELVYFPRFAGDGVFTTLLAKEDLSRITLSARGAGVSMTARPNARIFERYGEAGLRVTARRAGKLRIHATVDGMRTASRSVRVLPARRACAGSPRR